MILYNVAMIVVKSNHWLCFNDAILLSGLSSLSSSSFLIYVNKHFKDPIELVFQWGMIADI